MAKGKAMQPLEARRSIAEIAAERIREAILSGVYTQGERLNDFSIAADLGTSRASIREALKVLQAQGLVTQKPHHGMYVISPSSEDLRDACELRVALETHAVRVLARSHSVADLALLRQVLDRMQRAAALDDQLQVSQCDREFHETLLSLIGSTRLRQVYDREVLGLLSFFAVDTEAYRPLSEMAREFRPLLEAVEAGDGDRAAQLIEGHVRRATELLADHVAAGGGQAQS